MGGSVILAIETSQRVGGVAVGDGAGGVHVEMLHAAKRHDDDLLPAIDRLFGRLGLRPPDLGTVGVSVGPGGFTGLRIAISTVKMFAQALNVDVVAVPSALVAAADCKRPGPVMVALACKGTTWWATSLKRDDEGHWQIEGEPGLMELGAFDP
ncbi:MAG: tRNA (adenosine(37)-N6)-threonylcarbamoyltransferase complex dimerization subunit type 1 TsaB, partial [Planctomycetota bacterium]